MRFVAPTPTPKGFARRTPPAVFPAILGLLGLALAWRRAGALIEGAAPLADLIAGGAIFIFLVALVAYAAKLMRRLSVLADDITVLPGRLGLSALCGSLYLTATLAGAWHPVAAVAVFYLGLALHVPIIGLILRYIVTSPREARRYSPAGQLYFTSPIVGALAAASLGLHPLADLLFYLFTAVGLLIGLWGAVDLMKRAMPAPLRPLLALHLAAISVSGSTAKILGHSDIALGAAVLAALVLVLLLPSLRATLQSGFSALWAAFTFPFAATASLWLLVGTAWTVPGLLLLAAATGINLAIAYRIGRLWLGGQLAVKTNAAIA
ncbi:tellurium resistance protein [Frigidibacter sp. RF13]|uniref:SLAC1 family transporter n=1 Tax=Frigidibacter sp. RF13 TaxID=2997340 RepID=UPI002270109F|nr:tellurium resistance protein [Frigidibacter sp. RF13]MCY1125695.1 tellurium resistance protein [Frigidibacter sp. RF13]